MSFDLWFEPTTGRGTSCAPTSDAGSGSSRGTSAGFQAFYANQLTGVYCTFESRG